MKDPASSLQRFLVGGAVRDKLLGEPAGDRDWVVIGATEGAMKQLGFKSVGKEFPVFLHPVTGEEYALARRERKVASGYKGFAVDADSSVSLTEDLRRRDLTINAMAEDINGQLFDPFGGLEDLKRVICGMFHQHLSKIQYEYCESLALQPASMNGDLPLLLTQKN